MAARTLRTERLELVPLSADAIDALLAGDAPRLRTLAGAEFADPVGPPPYMAESLPVVQERLRKNPAEAEWWNWLVVRQDNAEAVGSVAFGGRPDPAGSVLIGYAMYPAREGSG
ncbi:MAG: GNAT family N-acetyltransferase, partial [Gemmatimonadales bacterium]